MFANLTYSTFIFKVWRYSPESVNDRIGFVVDESVRRGQVAFVTIEARQNMTGRPEVRALAPDMERIIEHCGASGITACALPGRGVYDDAE